MQNSRLFTIALVLLALILFLTDVRYDSPKPLPANAPADEFSAERARVFLEELLREGVPHPVGSAANAVVRDRIIERLRGMGYQAQVQTAVDCAQHGGCAQVENILARLEGTEGDRAVLLSVHYDSVWAGPGASDDGLGVAATLEIARMLKSAAPLRHDVIFLINDGEEAGLHGARAFAEKHPWASDVAVAVNVEARGASGASLMFETNIGNQKMVSLASSALARPATNSIYYTIYTLLPNDTDFTVYKRHSFPGVNFGIVGDAARYHTPADNFALASPGSLQHHGDNALAMVRGLAGSDLELSSKRDAVFFDVFTLFVVRWPAAWTLLMAIIGSLIIIAATVMGVRQGRMRYVDIAWGAAGFVVSVVAAGLVAYALHRILTLTGAYPTEWIAVPAPSLILFWVIPFGVVVLCARLFRSRNLDGMWAGMWSVWSAVAIGVASSYPGISYLFVVPALVAGVVALISLSRNAASSLSMSSLLGSASAGVLMFPVAWLLYDGMGTSILPAISAVVALCAATLVPLAIPAHPQHLRVVTWASIVAIAIGSIAAWALPKASPENPAPLSFTLFHQAEGSSRWVINRDAGALPQSLTDLGFAPAETSPYPWEPDQRPFVLDAKPSTPLEAPEVRIISRTDTKDGHTVRFHLRSLRGAPRAGVFVPAARATAATVHGASVPPRTADRAPTRQQYRSYLLTTMPPEGIEMEIAFTGKEVVEAFVWDARPLTAREGDPVLRARPSTHAPIGQGDRTVVSTKVRLGE